jgi:hypothetical protein
MRLLTLPITIVRVPIEIGFGAGKQAVKFAQGLVGGGEEPVAEKPRPAPPARRRSTSRRSGNGRAATGRGATGRSRSRAARSGATRATAARTPAPAPVADERAETSPPAERVAEPTAPVAEPTAEPTSPAPEPAVPVAEPTAPAPASSEEPAHVSEEPELVAEAAESGAENGAGAEVAVDAPWPGYDEMNASDIEDRLLTEGAETAAAVSLYEASRKGRASVLEAASRTMTA